MPNIIRMTSKLFGEDIIIVKKKKDLKEAKLLGEKIGAVVYTPREVFLAKDIMAAATTEEETEEANERLREIHRVKKELNGNFISIERDKDDRRKENSGT